MYIISNAAKNLLRNKGRNILMAIILLAIVVTSGVSIVINSTTSRIIGDYKNRFGVQISISPDLRKLQDAAQSGKTANLPAITPEQYQAFGKSKFLKETQLQAQVGATSDTLKAIDQAKSPSTGGVSGGTVTSNGSNGLQAVPMPTMQVIGYSNYNMLTDFSKGLRKISSGKIFQNKNECIVSEAFAKLNNLKVGDTIKIKSSSKDDQKFSLVVSGIYSDLTQAYSNSIHFSSMNRRNEILASFSTVTQMSNPDQAGITATYILKTPGDLPDFTKYVRSLGLSEAYDVSGDTASYNRIVGPVEGLLKVSLTFLIVVMILGAIILVLLATMSIRERKYEIGVLRAMGMKKAMVALGFLTEMLIITILCVGIGTAVSGAIAQPVSDILLKKQIQLADEQSKSGGSGFLTISVGQSAQTAEPPIDKVKISLDLKSFGETAGIAVLLVLISSMMSIVYITKYEPIKILTERT
jgi:ABC-type transport system, involved in lipoprotein release, permease component